MVTFRGYDRRVIPTGELAIGALIYYPGAGMLVPIISIRREGETTVLTVQYEVWGRQRRGLIRRKTSGTSTVHVRQSA